MIFYSLSYTTTFIRFFQVRKLLLFIAVFLTVGVNAQTYLMQNGTLNVCSGTFYDTGGSFGLYGANENLTMTFCAPVGQNVVLNFTSFGLSTALGGDYLTIYDGPTTASPQIPGSPFTGTVGPGQIFSTSGCFTLVFTSNFAGQDIGWEATIDCVGPPSCDDGYQNQGETDVDCGGPCPGLCYNNPGGTINACEGTFFDTGGSGGDYGNNENIVTTFCSPVAGQQILFDFTSFVLYVGDYLTIYDGPTTGSPMIGSYTQNNLNGLVTSTSGCLTFEFTSDGYFPSSGWVSRFSCYVPSCNDSILNQGECDVDCGGPCPQCLGCDNIGFEFADFTGWTGTTGVTNMSTAPAAYPDYVGNSSNLPSPQHTIMTGAGTDFCGGFPVVSPMGNYSVLLGDGRYIGSKGATIEKTFGVTSQNAQFTYWYAVVLQDPGHSPQEQPFFKVEAYDCSGAPISCGDYLVVASPGMPGFNSTNTCGIPSAPVYYKDWTPVFLDLTAYIGDNITLKFTVGDCSESGHFAYAYIDASCSPTNVLLDDTICQGESVTLSGPPGAASYLWSPGGQTTPSITVSPTATTTYTLTLTSVSSSSCNSVLTSTVVVLPPPVADFTYSVIGGPCNGGGTVNFTNTSTSGTYSWNFGDSPQWFNTTNPSHSYSTPGTYTVTLVASAGNCTDSISYQITILSGTGITSTATTVDVLCFGESNGSITATGSGGTTPYQYSIDGGVTWQGSGAFTGLVAGSYTIMVEDSNGCQTTVAATINEPGQVTLSATTVDVLCFGGNNGSITATGAGGTTPYQYSIDGGITWQGSGTYTGLVAGGYTIMVEDSNGCQTTVAATINEPGQVTLSATTIDVLCFGGNNGSITATGGGGTTPYQYSIDGGVTWQGSGAFTGLAAGSYTIMVEDSNGCQTTVATTINEPGQVTLSATAVDVLCFGGSNGSITATGAGGTTPYQYSIDGGITWQGSGTYTGLVAGGYTIMVEDSNGCQTTVAATINEPSQVTLSATTVDVLCFGGNNGSITATGVGGTLPYQYSIDGGLTWQTSGSFTGLVAGGYTIMVEDSNGCQTTVAATINEPSQVLLNLVSAINTTCGSANGVVDVIGTGGTTPYQYSIDGGITWQASGSFTGLLAGSYTITVEDSNGCQSTLVENIIDLSGITATYTQTNISCFGGNDGVINVLASGSVAPYQYSIDGGITWQASGTFAGLVAGGYTITVEDANRCPFIVTIILTEPSQVTLSATTVDVLCFGGNNGSITATGAGGTTPYQYSIDGGITWQTSGSFTGLAAGGYTIMVEDSNGCQTTVATTINEPSQVTLSATTVDVLCFGGNNGSITATGAGGTLPYQYSIDGGITWQASATYTGLAAGGYTIMVEDSNGCQTTVAATINEPSQVTLSATTVDVLCFGGNNGSITATGAGGTTPYQYSIDGGGTWQGSGSFTGLVAGSYTIMVEDSNGCQTTVATTINEPGQVTLSATTIDVLCFGGNNGSITATGGGGTTPYQYSIDGGVTWQGSGAFTGLAAGSYTIMVEDSNGCQTTVATTINEPGQVTLSATAVDVLCFGGSNGSITATGAGGTTPYQYSIDGGITWQGSGTYTGLVAGGYTIMVEDSNGCQTTVAATINEPSQLNINTTMNPSHCGQSDGSVGVVATGGTIAIDYNYLWSDIALISIGTNSTVSNLSAGSYIISVSDDNGCIITDTVVVSDVGNLMATASLIKNVSCNGMCDGEAIVSVTGGTSPLSYSWNGGSTPSDSINIGLCSGSFIVTVSDVFGCTDTSSIVISEPSPLIIDASVQDEICLDDCMGAINIVASGGTAPYLYSIDNCLTIGTNPNFSNLCSGNYNICVEDTNGCKLVTNYTVNSGLPYTQATILPIGPFCESDSSELLVAVNTGGIWSGLGVQGNTFNPLISGAGSHTIYYEIPSICSAIDSITIDVNSLPFVSFVADTTRGCEPLNVTFTSMVTTGACFWEFGDGATSTSCNPVHLYQNPGTFSVKLTVTSAEGCVNSLVNDKYISVYPNPIADFIPDPARTDLLSPMIKFTDNSFGATSWFWDFGDGDFSHVQNPSHSYSEPGTYEVFFHIINKYGCPDSISKNIIIDPMWSLYVPNAFTPNGDGVNDFFFAKGVNIKEFNMLIFNRWGELIFEGNSIDDVWDGYYKGELVQTGVYVWKIFAKDIQNVNHRITGKVSLLK